ncbi:uncharacterized protein [Halyomorpha halys]|uniref:uncharacterized protein isoform X2 n=1 Tax=Halyomorpha halys TaxID=286706 RepID=UPI0006D4D617|nr:uncharacterized protein LOC106685975 isoform X2 [Halyomorpha halys]
MADIFRKEDVCSLLMGKHILFIGDSNIRALYKDILWLYKMNSLISLSFLKRRLENNFLGDRLIARSELTRGRDFTEHRIFEDGRTTFEFLFVTRCYCDNIVNMVNDIKDGRKHCPDVILMNSCLWDVSRWGPSGVGEYKSNLDKLMKLLTSSLPKHVLFIWGTALPIAASTSGGLIIKQIEFMQAILRIHVIEANSFSASLAASYGYDVLDFHHYMRYQIIRRSADGIHFLPTAMRFLTNLLLTHIALSWDVKLPGNLKLWALPLASNIENAIEASANHEMKQMFKNIEILADTLNKSVADTPNKKKRKKNKKKIQNIKVTHFVKQSEVVNPVNLQPERKLAKTPPNYHKASLVQRTVSDIQNNNFVSHIDYGDNNLPSHSNFIGQNIQITRHWNNDNASDLVNTEKDFRLIGFDDFNKSIDLRDALDNLPVYRQTINMRYAPHPPNINRYNDAPDPCYSGYNDCNRAYHPVQLPTVPKFSSHFQHNLMNNPVYEYYDRFSSHGYHPYKFYHDNEMAWRSAGPYQNNNPGPMRQRKPKYNYRR